jgi:hypothetical protein
MKRNSYPIVAMTVLLTFLACLRSFGDDKEKYGFYAPRNDEEIYGTWVNMTYPGDSNQYPQKFVLHFWGEWEEYRHATQDTYLSGTFVLVDRWTDSEGNIWYKDYIRMRNCPYPSFELDKISKDGTVWEYVFSPRDFPTADNMNSTNPYYRIYYRSTDF